MKRAIPSSLLLFAIWLMLSGHFEPTILGFGVASVALVVWTSHRMMILDEEGQPFHLALKLIAFLPWLMWEIVKANVDVAKIIWSPQLKINSQTVHVDATQTTPLGYVMHANTITITPGTVSLDVRDHAILIHSLTDEAAAIDQSGMIDRKICALEGSA
ncbi:MAG: Na+/H+ antiporter subunit E [Polyangiaceae bacterium]|nr:Na+/H+ antiporter subunit E [Polyangiaceae bacterium]